MSPRLFDIILPTYNNLPELKVCLGGLAKQTLSDFRALVCVDGSTDGTVDYLSTVHFPFAVEVLEHPDRENHGRNTTRNLALPHLRAEYVAFLDTDMIADPELLLKHRDVLLATGGVSVGRVAYTNTGSSVWARYLMTRGRSRFPHRTQMHHRYFNTGNAALPADAFRRVRGQDSAMRHYGGGDLELAIRLRNQSGLAFYNNTKASAYSVMTKSLDEALSQLTEFGRHNLHHIVGKHPGEGRLYRADLMAGTGPAAWAFRGACSPIPAACVRVLLSLAPRWSEPPLVHYLAVCAVLRGFREDAE